MIGWHADLPVDFALTWQLEHWPSGAALAQRLRRAGVEGGERQKSISSSEFIRQRKAVSDFRCDPCEALGAGRGIVRLTDGKRQDVTLMPKARCDPDAADAAKGKM